jgi:hypothetical protein
VVPALAATASGRICVANRCDRVSDATAYHDHNWGVWRGVTWEWGAAQGDRLSLLYGGVFGPENGGTSPFFLALVDSLGVRRVFRFGPIAYRGSRAADGLPGARAPERFTLRGSWESDSVTLSVEVDHALATQVTASTHRRTFLQMRGRFELSGRVMGDSLRDRGEGFFETYLSQ